LSGIYHLHFRGQRASQARRQQKQGQASSFFSLPHASAGVSLGLLFNPEHEGDTFLSKHWALNYMDLQPITWYSYYALLTAMPYLSLRKQGCCQ
jgi:hypothetical protein